MAVVCPKGRLRGVPWFKFDHFWVRQWERVPGFARSHPERSEGGKVGEAQSIRAERESRPKVARRAATGVAGNDPVHLPRTLPAKMDSKRVQLEHCTFELERAPSTPLRVPRAALSLPCNLSASQFAATRCSSV